MKGAGQARALQVARRQLHLLLLPRAIWERRMGGRPRRKCRMCVCAWNVCSCMNAVRPSWLRTGTARSSSSTSSLFPSSYSPLPRLCNRRNRESYFHTSLCAICICTKMKDTIKFSPLRTRAQERLEFDGGHTPVLRRSN